MIEAIAWPVAVVLCVAIISAASIYISEMNKTQPQDPNDELRAELREMKSKVQALAVKRGLSPQ
jgi:uncharacterized membrane protein YqhA